ncbi:Carbonic anhydrase [Rhynchospora pubera]|uniref:Carbonic anhydrase n=1 Tax=Rhynchospora pubera TaxID=906938 RepID=A0AAV8GBA9_9POAL|nr:Carbonic anhydrase [Rhynchospora pubera]
MKPISSNMQFMITTFLSLCVLFISPASTRGDIEEAGFNYVPGSDIGPDRWGVINENWATCGMGREQSPIDITEERIQEQPDLGRLLQKYQPARAALKNQHTYLEVEWNGNAGSITIDETRYNVIQFHWHSPSESEHTINGQRYDLEMHIVHQNIDNETARAVVAVLYAYGHPDPFITKLEPLIRNANNVEEQPIGLVDPREAQGINTTKYYRYMGSLTVPPCTEGVVWTVLDKIRTVSTEQVNLMKQALPEEFKNNSRPLQNIYDRTIGLHQI